MKKYWQIFKWMWSVTKGYRGTIAMCTLLGALNICFGWGFVWASKYAVDVATHEAEGNIYVALSFLPCLMIGELVCTMISIWIAEMRNVKLDNKLKQDIFRHLIDSEWRGIEKYHTGDVVNRIEGDVTSVVGFATETCPDILILLFQLVGSFIMLWYLDSTLAIIVICVSPVFLLFARLYSRKLHKIIAAVRGSDSKIQCQIQENLQHRSVIKTLEQTDSTIGRLTSAMNTLVEQVLSRTKLTIATRLFLSGGFGLSYILTFGWGVLQIYHGIIGYGTMVAFLQLSGRVQRPIADLSKQIPVFVRCFTSAERLLELANLPKEQSIDQPMLEGKIGIRLTNVNFKYPELEGSTVANSQVLEGFNWTFKPAESVAILGETGAGKTTLIRMLLALIRPDSGDIEVVNDRGESQPLDAGSRRYFTYVPQGNTLLSGTIRSNLLLGNAKATEEDMKTALHQAAADFVLSLPKQLDTECGENGGGLSEGQAQRIAIARALLRKAPVLLLDESTSALDPETEQKVLNNIAECFKDKLVVLVTHRPAAAERCDEILQF